MKTQYGNYQLYKGNIWISEQDETQEIQGTNIAIRQNNVIDDLRVLGYVIRKGDKWTHDHNKYYTLDEIIWSVLKSYGWYDEVCRRYLGEN